MKFICIFSVSSLISLFPIYSQSPDSSSINPYSLIVDIFLELHGPNFGPPIEIPGPRTITEFMDNELAVDAQRSGHITTNLFRPYLSKLQALNKLYSKDKMLSLRLLEQAMQLPKGTFDRLVVHMIHSDPNQIIEAYRILGEYGLDRVSMSSGPLTPIDPQRYNGLNMLFEDDYYFRTNQPIAKKFSMVGSVFLKEHVLGIQVMDLLVTWVVNNRLALNIAREQVTPFLARMRSLNLMYFASFAHRFKTDSIILIGEPKHLNLGENFCIHQLPILQKMHPSDWYEIKMVSKQKLEISGSESLTSTDLDRIGSDFKFIVDERDLSDVVREKKARKFRYFKEHYVTYPFKYYNGQYHGNIPPEHYAVYKMRSFQTQDDTKYNAIFMERKNRHFIFEAWSEIDPKMFKIALYGVPLDDPTQIGDELNRAWKQFQIHSKKLDLSILASVDENVEQYHFGKDNKYMAKVLLWGCDD